MSDPKEATADPADSIPGDWLSLAEVNQATYYARKHPG
jgi:hypothetical protein